MKIYDIEILNKDFEGNFDLTQATFKSDFQSVGYSRYEVQKGEEMRIDLVCHSIYGNTDYIDIILNVNEIDNPLNIKEGTILIYPTSGIDSLRFSEKNNELDTKVLGNSNKQRRIDNNRKKYLENNLALPPTTLENRTQQFDISSDIIVLGSGLF